MQKKKKLNSGNIIAKIFLYIFMLEMAYVILMPFITQILSAFMDPSDLLDSSVQRVPKNWSTYYWSEAWKALEPAKYGLRTFLLSLFVGVAHTFSCSLVGYGLARFKFKGRGIVFAVVMVVMLVPNQIYNVAEFLHFNFFRIGPFTFNLTDTIIPNILLSVFCMGTKCGLYIYLLREFFMGLPKDLENAAYIDGASSLQAYFRVALPNAKTVMIMVFLFSFCWTWTSDGGITIQNPILLMSRSGTLSIQSYGSIDTIGTAIARNALSLLVMAPLLLLFVFCQKALVQSISRTGIAN